MHARTIYAIGDPARIEDSLESLRTEAPKLLAESPGYRSFGLLADREQGKITMSSWWETERDRANSDAHLGERRTELLTPFADSILVGNAEVAAFAASAQYPSAGTARLGRFMIEPSSIDDMVEVFNEVGMPKMHDLSGFCAAALFIDRDAGIGSVWDSVHRPSRPRGLAHAAVCGAPGGGPADRHACDVPGGVRRRSDGGQPRGSAAIVLSKSAVRSVSTLVVLEHGI